MKIQQDTHMTTCHEQIETVTPTWIHYSLKSAPITTWSLPKQLPVFWTPNVEHPRCVKVANVSIPACSRRLVDRMPSAWCRITWNSAIARRASPVTQPRSACVCRWPAMWTVHQDTPAVTLCVCQCATTIWSAHPTRSAWRAIVCVSYLPYIIIH